MSVVVTVADLSGHPLPGLYVWVDCLSGGVMSQTDEYGLARMRLGEQDFTRIQINGVTVMRDHLLVDVTKGLLVAIVIKDTNALPADFKP